MLLPSNIHDSWKPFLTPKMIKSIEEIERKIKEKSKNNFNPEPADKALRLFTVDLNSIKIIIQGMDAYPSTNKAVATGRAFEVGTLTTWDTKFRQNSLKNIVRLLYKDYNGDDEIQKYSKIKKEISKGEFKILPPNEIFDAWEQQGVLCLNIYPTCERKKPGSHKEIWESFSIELIKFLSTNYPDLKWFLWGKESQSFEKHIEKGECFKSHHPTRNSTKSANDFLKSDCFKSTMEEINWLGI